MVRVGVSINSCDVKSDDIESLASQIDWLIILTSRDERKAYCAAPEPLEADHHVGTRRSSGQGT